MEPLTRGLEAAKKSLIQEIDRLKITASNLEQAVVMLYGPFPPQPAAASLGGKEHSPDDLQGLLRQLDAQISHVYTLSNTINVGH